VTFALLSKEVVNFQLSPKTGTSLFSISCLKFLIMIYRSLNKIKTKYREIVALLKKSSTHHEFGKIWPNLAIEKKIKKFKSSGER